MAHNRSHYARDHLESGKAGFYSRRPNIRPHKVVFSSALIHSTNLIHMNAIFMAGTFQKIVLTASFQG
jgi:hypothetical protein